MSNEQQVRILNALVQIMHDSTHGRYEEMHCEFDYEVYEGGWSVGSKYSIVRDGLNISSILDDPEDKASILVNKLHDLMKSHTGGDWKKIVLSIGFSGKANAKFIY